MLFDREGVGHHGVGVLHHGVGVRHHGVDARHHGVDVRHQGVDVRVHPVRLIVVRLGAGANQVVVAHFQITILIDGERQLVGWVVTSRRAVVPGRERVVVVRCLQMWLARLHVVTLGDTYLDNEDGGRVKRVEGCEKGVGGPVDVSNPRRGGIGGGTGRVDGRGKRIDDWAGVVDIGAGKGVGGWGKGVRIRTGIR